MSGGVLEIFLLVNVFAAGVLLPIAIRHALAHFRKDSHKEKAETSIEISPEVKEEMALVAKDKFQKTIDHSARHLEQGLDQTSIKLSAKLDKLGSDIVENEMKRYRASVEALQAQTENNLSNASSEIAKHQAELKSKIDDHQKEIETKITAELEEEKQMLISQIDTKIADAVTSFLVETLQHNVDIGAQTDYIMQMLEEHKSELKKEVSDEN